MLREIIAFIAGTMAGVMLMCIVSVTPKGQQEDDDRGRIYQRKDREWCGWTRRYLKTT